MAVVAAVLGLHLLVLQGVEAGVKPTAAVEGSATEPPATRLVAMTLPAPQPAVEPAVPTSPDPVQRAAEDAPSAAPPVVAATPRAPVARARPAASGGPVLPRAAEAPPTAAARADGAGAVGALHAPRDAVPLVDISARGEEAATAPSKAADAAGAAADAEPSDLTNSDLAQEAVRLAAAGPSAGAAAQAEPVPVYTTRVPPAFQYGYALHRGSIGGEGEIALSLGPQGYEARLEGRVAGMRLLDWTSRGRVDASGLAPQRFVESRIGRSARAANFERDAVGGPRITYSASSDSRPLPAGAQDRLSWMLQLAAIAEAAPERVANGQQISMYVTGVRGDADVWTFRVVGREPIDTPLGRIETVHLLREPRKPYDTRADVWIDPLRHHLPVRARLASQQDDKDAFELLLQRVSAGTS